MLLDLANDIKKKENYFIEFLIIGFNGYFYQQKFVLPDIRGAL